MLGKDLPAGQTVWEEVGVVALWLGANQGAEPLVLKGKPGDPGSSQAYWGIQHSPAHCLLRDQQT